MTTAKELKRLTTFINRFPEMRILVVGDIVLDHYIRGKVSRISPEAPVPVVHIHRETHAAGGAANVASNIAALGGQVSLVGVVGNDLPAERLAEFAFLQIPDSPVEPVKEGPSGIAQAERESYEGMPTDAEMFKGQTDLAQIRKVAAV